MDPHKAFMRFVDSQQIRQGVNGGYINDPLSTAGNEARNTSDPKDDKVLAGSTPTWSTRRCSSGRPRRVAERDLGKVKGLRCPRAGTSTSRR